MQDLGFTMRFSNGGGRRSWTETFYVQYPDLTPALTQEGLRLVCNSRAGALVAESQIVDVVYWNVANPRLRTLFGVYIPGRQGWDLSPSTVQDIAPAAVLVTLSSATRTRKYLMRGLVDLDVVNGQFQPVASRISGYTQWFQFIKNYPLRLRVSTFDPPRVLAGATSSGLQLASAAPITTGSICAVRTNIAGGGPRVSTRVKITADSLTAEWPCKWKRGNCTGGTVRKFTQAIEPILAYAERAAVRTRKTGGPLSRFRGRR